MTVNKNRLIERSAVNAFRALMERHNFIVQEIDGGNDHGEDVYVSFTENMKRTGDTILVQVKGGRSYKTASGYRVPIEDHREYWERSNAPVFCVVQDVDSQELFWANASAQLLEAKRLKKEIKSIKVEKKRILNDKTVTTFSLRARLYIAETGDLHKFLTKISGVQFDIADYVAYFENLYGERMIFRQKRDEEAATLLHADLGWEPISITADDVAFNKPALQFPQERSAIKNLQSADSRSLTIRDVILNKSEYMWVEACFEASEWIRKRNPDLEAQKMLSVHRVSPIIYTPRQELAISSKAWRNQPGFGDLMERFIELGYEYWQHADEYFDGQSITRKPARPKGIVWNEMREIVRQLRSWRTPTHYIIGNRGRLTRTEIQRLCELGDYPG